MVNKITKLNWLIALREKKGLKQKDLCEILNININTYGCIELGTRNPSPLNAIKLSEFFKFHISKFEKISIQNNGKTIHDYNIENIRKWIEKKYKAYELEQKNNDRRNWLISLRKEQGLTASELSEKLGINKSTYGSIEAGWRNPSPKNAIIIAKYFNISMEKFYETENV